MTTALVEKSDYAIMPVLAIEDALARRQAIVEFTAKVMVEGHDYGQIPGTNQKNVLLKAGAEKLNTLFGLSPYFEIVESETDWTGDHHNDEPFFYYHYRCILKRGELVVGMGEGSCNSWEKKYRYRKGSLACPSCGQVGTVIKGKAEYGGGWLCFRKKDGCGAKFPDNDPQIVNQEVGEVKNDNPADLVNTIKKMAQKRALIAATLIAVNASEFFTQDLEDMDFGVVIEGKFTIDDNDGDKGGSTEGGSGQSSQAPSSEPIPDWLQGYDEAEREIAQGKNAHFVSLAIKHIPRYDHPNAVKGSLNKLGIRPENWDYKKRVQIFNTLRDYAGLRDKGLPQSLAIAVINQVITEKEAWAQTATKATDIQDEDNAAMAQSLFSQTTQGAYVEA
jgi:hypothetical protein